MNVDEVDKFPFLKQEISFLEKIIKQDIPCLGICLGAQLLAKAAGANIHKNAIEEIGWYAVNLTQAGEKDPLFNGVKEKINVLITFCIIGLSWIK